MMSTKTVNLTPQESQLLERAAQENGRLPGQQLAFLVRQGLGLEDGLLSPVSIAALTQVAKDEGLDSLDAAVEFLIKRELSAVFKGLIEAIEEAVVKIEED